MYESLIPYKTPDAQFDKLGSLWFSEWTYFGAFYGALRFFRYNYNFTSVPK